MAFNPTRIGKYDVEGIIGRGGMGVVYKAVDSQIGRYVAIKMITGDGDLSLIERFKSEARSMGSLQCPNIVTVYDAGEQDGHPYLVMQFLEGPSLESMIRKGVTLSLPATLGIIIDVCNGLAYAHQRGVIHRDIKPANIIVLQDGSNDGMAVIVDFGIARIVGDTRFTGADQIIGSVHYMSAEQLQAKELDNRTDIYSIGVVLYQLLTGALPFDADETAATLHKILNESPPPLGAYLKEFPAELQLIVSRVLAKNRVERYATAQDLAFDLMQVQDDVKAETVSQLVRRAEVAVNQQEWTQAREQLQQALRIDRHNSRAKKLMIAVQERFRLQQEIEQARALQSQANEAYLDQQYDEALRLLDQAVRLDTQNNDLLSFRDSVRVSKERATRLSRALRRAEAALQAGDLDEAQSAMDDAFEIDPHDTHAKALKAIVSRHAEEKCRQEQLRKLLGQARDQIAARHLTEAFATLKTAEALDATSNELQTVSKMAASAREQERRRSETEELCRQIEAALVQEDYATAVARADEGLQRFPQEQNLVKLRALAEAQRRRVEQKKLARDQFAAASLLAESGQLPQALAVLDSALQQVTGSSEMETLRSTLRDRVAVGESEQQKANAIDAILAKAGMRILARQGELSAGEFLDTVAAQYADSPQTWELCDPNLERGEPNAPDGRLAAEVNPARRVQFAEKSLRSSPNNHWIRQRLPDAQRVRDQIVAVIERVVCFDAVQRSSGAIQQWWQRKNAYSQLPWLESHISRLAGSPGQAREVAPFPPTKASQLPPDAKVAPAVSFSATRVLGSVLWQDAEIIPEIRDPTMPETATDSPNAATAFPPRSGTTQCGLFRLDVQRQMANLVAGLRKYLAIAVTVVVLAAAYLLVGHGRQPARVKPSALLPIPVHIITNPADAVVTSDSQPVANGSFSLVPGTSVTVVVARLGYKTKSVEVRQASEGTIALDPEPLHLSIQTGEKSETVELDGQKIADLADGNLEKYDFVLDGKSHELKVTAQGKPLFTLQLQAMLGSVPEVNAFDAKGLFLITSLGSRARLYAGSQLKNVRLGDQNITVSPSGADLSLSEQDSEVKFGEGDGRGSVAIENSNAPMLAVYSANTGGQVQITSNVAGATLKVNGTPLKSQRRGWLVSRPPGKYTFELSAEGYESQKWTMTLVSRQIFPTKNVDLKVHANAVMMATFVIAGGTPEAQVDMDGKRLGKLDANGNLEVPNVLADGQHTVGLSKPNYESREVPVVAKLPETRLSDAKLMPWPTLEFHTTTPSVTVKYARSGESQVHQATASEKLILAPGQYELTAEAPGFQKYTTKLNLAAGDDGSIPLKLDPLPDYEFQDATQVVHDGAEWIRSKDPHAFVQLKPGLLHATLILAKPGKNLFWNKKIEWRIETADRSASVDYVLDGQKMVRKLVTGEATSDLKEARGDVTAATQVTSLSVHIQADGSHVVIRNDKGVVLDDYTAPPPHNFAGGRIGIKTGSQFVVRDR